MLDIVLYICRILLKQEYTIQHRPSIRYTISTRILVVMKTVSLHNLLRLKFSMEKYR